MVDQKSPLLAAIASFFIPGLGQVYNGEGILKGLLFWIGTVIGSIIFILPGVAVWLYGIYNAYKVAKRMNMGEVPYRQTSLVTIIIYIVIIFVIGLIIAFIAIMFSAVIFAFLYGISESMVTY